MNSMLRSKKYRAAFSIGKSNRKAFMLNIFSDYIYIPLRILLLIVVWSAMFHGMRVESLHGYTRNDMILYYTTLIIIGFSSRFFSSYSYLVWQDITSGEISRYLCRPINYVVYQLSYGLGYTRYLFLVTALFSFLLWILNNPVERLPLFVCFLVSVMLSILLVFSIHMAIGFASFFISAIFGLRDLIFHILQLFSGALVPLEFLPGVIGHMGRFLPFRHIYSTPMTIFLSRITFIDALSLLSEQIIFTSILMCIVFLMWKAGRNKYTAQGG